MWIHSAPSDYGQATVTVGAYCWYVDANLDMTPSWEMFIAPALTRSNMTVEDFEAALVEFPANGGHSVELNGAVRDCIEIRPASDDLRGLPVTGEGIASMQPLGVPE